MAHECKTTTDLPELNKRNGNKAQLQLTTDAYNGQIVSTAQVVFIMPDGGITFELCGDYSKRFKVLRGRGTQKAIDTQHAETFTAEALEGIKGDVAKFYAEKLKEEEDAA